MSGKRKNDDSNVMTSKKEKKDKNAPKNARSAYSYFMEEVTSLNNIFERFFINTFISFIYIQNRASVKEANPTADFGAMARLLADKWKVCDAESKAHYEQLALQDKSRYINIDTNNIYSIS